MTDNPIDMAGLRALLGEAITQEDREAAASLYAVYHDVWAGYSACGEIQEGGKDDGPWVQAFAAHRRAVAAAIRAALAPKEPAK